MKQLNRIKELLRVNFHTEPIYDEWGYQNSLD